MANLITLQQYKDFTGITGLTEDAKINVIVGKPIQYKDFELPEGSTKDKYEFITNMVMDKIKELKEKISKKLKSKKSNRK